MNFCRCDRSGVAGTVRLAHIRCPAGGAYDIDRQTCDWKSKVESCDRLSSKKMFHYLIHQNLSILRTAYKLFNILHETFSSYFHRA